MAAGGQVCGHLLGRGAGCGGVRHCVTGGGEGAGRPGSEQGVLPVFATQRFNQIRPSTREAVKAFNSLVVFRQGGVEVAEEMSKELREAYSIDEISALEVGRCAARLSYDGVPQPAFTLRPDNL